MKKILFYLFALSIVCTACQTDSSSNIIFKGVQDGYVLSEGGKKINIENYDDPNGITFFIVRHAEKETGSDDPPLSEIGNKRAKRLAELLSHVPIKLATSSNFLRTTQTANPFVRKAYEKNSDIEISVYNPNDLGFFFNDILEERKGQKILVVGHSDSVPALLNLFLDKEVYKEIPETEYNNLYVVTYRGKGDAEVMDFKY